MDSTTHVLILFIICLSLSSHSISTTFATAISVTPSKLVKEACKPSDSYHLCVQVLGSDRRTNTAPNLVALSKIMLEILTSNATSTQDYIREIIKTQPAKKATLEKCIQCYDGVIRQLKGALRAVEDKEYEMVDYSCHEAGDEAKSCATFMASGGVQDSSMIARNKHVEKLSYIASAVTGGLH